MPLYILETLDGPYVPAAFKGVPASAPGGPAVKALPLYGQSVVGAPYDPNKDDLSMAGLFRVMLNARFKIDPKYQWRPDLLHFDDEGHRWRVRMDYDGDVLNNNDFASKLFSLTNVMEDIYIVATDNYGVMTRSDFTLSDLGIKLVNNDPNQPQSLDCAEVEAIQEKKCTYLSFVLAWGTTVLPTPDRPGQGLPFFNEQANAYFCVFEYSGR